MRNPSASNTGKAASFAAAAWISLLLAAGLSAAPKPLDESRVRRAGESVRQLLFGKALLAEAERHIGRPYAWGDKGGKRGFDCSGYSSYVYASLGVTLPKDALGQFQQGVAIERPALAPGDLVFFASGSADAVLHVGIYAGEGEFLHAPGEGKLIGKSSMDSKAFAGRYIGARRYFPQT